MFEVHTILSSIWIAIVWLQENTNGIHSQLVVFSDVVQLGISFQSLWIRTDSEFLPTSACIHQA